MQDGRQAAAGRAAAGPGGRWRSLLGGAAWIALAGGAALYLGLVFAGAEGPISIQARPAPPKPDPALAALTAEMSILHTQVEALTGAMHDLRARGEAIERRLDDLRSALGPATGALPPATAAADANPAPAAAASAAEAPAAGAGGMLPPTPRPGRPTSVTVARMPLPADGFGDAALDASPLPIATPTQPSRTRFAVELGDGDQPAALKARWRELRAKHGALLEGLEARSGPAAEGLPWNKLRLLAGPIANAADAARICARLKAAKVECKETVFDGAPL